MVDTQIPAAFTGRPLSCGFATLVAEYMKVELDKSESRTDWLARPLTERQCVYAAADVFYLLPMAKQLVQETEEAGWTAAANNECLLLCQRRSETLAPALAYREISNAAAAPASARLSAEVGGMAACASARARSGGELRGA